MFSMKFALSMIIGIYLVMIVSTQPQCDGRNGTSATDCNSFSGDSGQCCYCTNGLNADECVEHDPQGREGCSLYECVTTTTSPIQPECDDNVFQCGDHAECMHTGHACDGIPQCTNNQFHCDDTCFPNDYMCDGDIHCDDLSDELNCNTTSNIKCGDVVSDVVSDDTNSLYKFFINDSYDHVDFYVCYNFSHYHFGFGIDGNFFKDESDHEHISDYCANGEHADEYTVLDMTGIHLLEIRQPEIFSNYTLEVNCISRHISCGDVISHISHPDIDGCYHYELSINDSYDLNFDDCHSNVDMDLIITDYEDNEITNEYCPSGTDKCGYCSNGKNIHKNFTIPNMPAGDYSVEICPFHNETGLYNLSVSCSKPSIQTITCGEPVSGTINNFRRSYYYQFISNGQDDVNFYHCHSNNTYWVIKDSSDNTIHPSVNVLRPQKYVSGYCDNGNNYLENSTIQNMPAGVYLIRIFSIDSYDEIQDGDFNLRISCKPSVQKITCGSVVSNTTNNFQHSYYYEFNHTGSNVNLQHCHSANINWFIKDSLDNMINTDAEVHSPHTYISDFCTDNHNNYLENSTMENMSPDVYLIKIFSNNSADEINEGFFKFKVSCSLTSVCGDDSSIIAFAFSGIVQTILAIITLWFVVGYLIRFRTDQKIIIFSVIGCLFLAFVHGSVRSFILTNVIFPDAEIVLRLRCNALFWHQIFILQLGQLLMYIYLLSKLQSLGVFKTSLYYFLLLFVSIIIVFTTATLPWYTVPMIETGDCDSELIMCINATPSDADIYEEYTIFLFVNVIAQFVLLFVFLYQFYQLCTESGCCTCGRNTFSYRILTLGMVLVFFHVFEFICFCITEETFHPITFIIYSIVILLSFNICGTNDERDSTWCCWCCIDDKVYTSLDIETQNEQECDESDSSSSSSSSDNDNNDNNDDNICVEPKIEPKIEPKVLPYQLSVIGVIRQEDESIGLIQ